MDTTLVLTWGLSNAISWALSGINSPIGDMLRSSGFKTLIYLLGLSASIIALITTYSIFCSQTNHPVFSLTVISWLLPHIAGAIYTVIATGYKFITQNI